LGEFQKKKLLNQLNLEIGRTGEGREKRWEGISKLFKYNMI